ncbi:hypothetical protein N5079_24875 [Planotetraspora sp. A-T 1434]|uniref:hypothetical protein n=1 Tax=Planotetraspora sp. A-T 1434 TaxID=2979219 RepID=UPI0021BE2F32|nr:hypothetical protein [Planotetraspora sp. A-T 1434]MCT9933453.1 hypothetical protein [Planotetraspora sp. A-T 1434]
MVDAVRISIPGRKSELVELSEWASGVTASVHDVRVALAGLTTSVSELKQQNADLRSLVARQRAELSEAVTTASRLRGQVDNLQKQVAELQSLEDRFTGLDRRFTNIAGDLASVIHPGKVTEDEHGHLDLGAAYADYLVRHVQPLVYLERTGGKPFDARGQAEVIAEVCQSLFGSEAAVPARLGQVLAAHKLVADRETLDELCAAAGRLRAEAERLGRDQRWEFSCPDDRYDPERQRPFVGSELGETAADVRVAFVVTPSYLVGDGKQIVPQQVFTVAA